MAGRPVCITLPDNVCDLCSNKKTLRVLTDEILKLKRQLARSSSTSDSDSTSDRLERGIALALRAVSPDTANTRR
jgi:hypothetical protein